MQAVSRQLQSDSAVECPQCGASQSSPVLELDNIPIIPNTAWATEQAALKAPLASVCLVSCSRCQLIYNATFDEDLITYTESYGNALHYSNKFQRYSEEIAARLAAFYKLRGKLVVEIGCGSGYFLELLCRMADCTGIGFDPSSTAEAAALETNVKILAEEFAGQRACRDASLICCRQVLEHFADPLALLLSLRSAMGTDSRADVFFEVPNALFMLEGNRFWDIVYEHCCYFTPYSLITLFERAGFAPRDVRTTFQDQYITLEAAAQGRHWPLKPAKRNEEFWQRKIDGFSASFESTSRRWRAFFEYCQQEKKRCVVWSAGAKGIMFLNLLQCRVSTLPYVVDISPAKLGKFVSGTGQEIVSPAMLREYRPDYVLLMNGAYEQEVQQELSSLSPGSEIILA